MATCFEHLILKHSFGALFETLFRRTMLLNGMTQQKSEACLEKPPRWFTTYLHQSASESALACKREYGGGNTASSGPLLPEVGCTTSELCQTCKSFLIGV